MSMFERGHAASEVVSFVFFFFFVFLVGGGGRNQLKAWRLGFLGFRCWVSKSNPLKVSR